MKQNTKFWIHHCLSFGHDSGSQGAMFPLSMVIRSSQSAINSHTLCMSNVGPRHNNNRELETFVTLDLKLTIDQFQKLIIRFLKCSALLSLILSIRIYYVRNETLPCAFSLFYNSEIDKPFVTPSHKPQAADQVSITRDAFDHSTLAHVWELKRISRGYTGGYLAKKIVLKFELSNY